MYSMAKQNPPSPLPPMQEQTQTQAQTDNRATFHQFNQHILLTVRAVNQMKTVFDVRGA